MHTSDNLSAAPSVIREIKQAREIHARNGLGRLVVFARETAAGNRLSLRGQSAAHLAAQGHRRTEGNGELL